MEKEEEYNKLITYALRLIVKKRYTCKEIENKLTIKCEDLNIIKRILERLKTLKYLDDLKFTEDYINDRVIFKPRGGYLIGVELYKRGINQDLFNEVMSKIDFDEKEIAIRLIKKRQKKWDGELISKQKEKAFRFLSSKGIKLEAIYKALDYCYNRLVEKDL